MSVNWNDSQNFMFHFLTWTTSKLVTQTQDEKCMTVSNNVA